MLRLLLEQDWRDLVDAAADCLLPLILAHQPAFQQFGERDCSSYFRHWAHHTILAAHGVFFVCLLPPGCHYNLSGSCCSSGRVYSLCLRADP